jgi:Holliday junction resolvase
LTVYPEIEVKMMDHLYIYIQGKDIIELTKEQFTEKFDACMAFIDQL